MVAINRKEAEDLAEQIGHDTKAEANRHLAEVKAPPTDPDYGNKYRVYAVKEKR